MLSLKVSAESKLFLLPLCGVHGWWWIVRVSTQAIHLSHPAHNLISREYPCMHTRAHTQEEKKEIKREGERNNQLDLAETYK